MSSLANSDVFKDPEGGYWKNEFIPIDVEDKTVMERLHMFCEKCDELGYKNNNSIKAMKLYWAKQTKQNGISGEFFCAVRRHTKKLDTIFAVAGCHPLPRDKFPMVNNNAWRIFFRRCELPGYSPYKGLFKDAGEKGREFIDAFIKHCSTDELYITTNVINDDNKNIVRYHRLMELVEKQKNSYINNKGQVKIGNHEQILWKLDLDKYYFYKQIRGFL